jgi:hypothetical protein
MSKAIQVPQNWKEFERSRNISRSPGTVADKCVLDVSELIEDSMEKLRNLTAGQVVYAVRQELTVEVQNLVSGQFFLVHAPDAERRPQPEISARS